VSQEFEPALDIAADIANADEPSRGVTENRGDLPSKLEGYWELFIGYQPRVFVRPANGVHQGSEVRSNIRMEGRTVFVRVGVIVLSAVRSIATGEIIRALGMNKVDLVKVRV